MAKADFRHAGEAVLFAFWVHGLGEAVGVEDQGVAGRQDDLAGSVLRAREEPEGNAGGRQLFDRAPGADDERRVVAGVRVAEEPSLGLRTPRNAVAYFSGGVRR